MCINASKLRSACLWLIAILLPLLAVFLGRLAVLPSVSVHYSTDGKEALKYIWNVQHRIYKGEMPPGGVFSDTGVLFPDEHFFMEVDWWGENVRHHCVRIRPKWPRTDIYLDAHGDIDTSESGDADLERLQACRGGTFEP